MAKHNYEFLALGPGAICQGRGVEIEGWSGGIRCKGAEQPEGLQGKIASISAAEAPQGQLKSAKGGVFLAVSLIT